MMYFRIRSFSFHLLLSQGLAHPPFRFQGPLHQQIYVSYSCMSLSWNSLLETSMLLYFKPSIFESEFVIFPLEISTPVFLS